jgi:hypothetical protein
MSYTVFVRNWWIKDSTYPGGKRPGPGRKTILNRNVQTETEARRICAAYNDNTDPGALSRKAEYMSN